MKHGSIKLQSTYVCIYVQHKLYRGTQNKNDKHQREENKVD